MPPPRIIGDDQTAEAADTLNTDHKSGTTYQAAGIADAPFISTKTYRQQKKTHTPLQDHMQLKQYTHGYNWNNTKT